MSIKLGSLTLSNAVEVVSYTLQMSKILENKLILSYKGEHYDLGFLVLVIYPREFIFFLHQRNPYKHSLTTATLFQKNKTKQKQTLEKQNVCQ